jgi:K+-transporting ATPase ATPase C chain
MKSFKTALRLFIIWSVITGILYPLTMTGVAQLLFPNRANGSFLVREGKIIGSELIGQNFTQDKYIHGRPSAVDYDARVSGASNYGPMETKFREQVAERIRALKKSDNLPSLPADIITASASGLDPHLSAEAAMVQIPRIAKARNMAESAVSDLIRTHTESPWCGSPYINVLKLNLALDAASGAFSPGKPVP